MERIGFITKILPDNKCKVLVSRISGCKGNCKTCGGCPTPEVHIDMENTVDAKRGDYVKIGVDSKIILRYAMFLYGFPLTLFILSIILLNVFFPKLKNIDIMGFIVGIVVMALSFFVVKFVDKKYAHLSTKAMFIEEKIKEK